MPQGATLRIVNTHPSASLNIMMIQGRQFQGRNNGDIVWNLEGGNQEEQHILTNNTPNPKGGIPLVRTPRTEDLNGHPAIIEVELSDGVTELKRKK